MRISWFLKAVISPDVCIIFTKYYNITPCYTEVYLHIPPFYYSTLYGSSHDVCVLAQPTPHQQARVRRSAYAPADGEGTHPLYSCHLNINLLIFFLNFLRQPLHQMGWLLLRRTWMLMSERRHQLDWPWISSGSGERLTVFFIYHLMNKPLVICLYCANDFHVYPDL